MEHRIAVKTYIDDLFRYLDTFERESDKFQTEAFFQTYNGIGAVFQALRQQRDQAVEVDQHLLDHVKQSPLTSSDIRLLTTQILVTFFEVEADIDGRSNKAFTYCRGLRAVKQDGPYFESVLTPTLFRPGALSGNYALNAFFLKELARYLNVYGQPLNPNLSPEAFAAMSDPLKMLELQRRHLQLGSDLLSDRGSVEFHLSRVEGFAKLAQAHPLMEKYLKGWQYLVETSWWSRLRTWLAESGGKGRGALSNWRYLRLVLTQRSPAYFFYGLMIVLFLGWAILMPSLWQSYEDQRLQEFEQRVGGRPTTTMDPTTSGK
ncbi:MAG: hypothetical protein ABIE70_02420 [bacterium]